MPFNNSNSTKRRSPFSALCKEVIPTNAMSMTEDEINFESMMSHKSWEYSGWQVTDQLIAELISAQTLFKEANATLQVSNIDTLIQYLSARTSWQGANIKSLVNTTDIYIDIPPDQRGMLSRHWLYPVEPDPNGYSVRLVEFVADLGKFYSSIRKFLIEDENSEDRENERNILRRYMTRKYHHEPVVYALWDGLAVKIGTTTKISSRMNTGSTFCSQRDPDVLAIMRGDEPIEKTYLDRLRPYTTNRDWFKPCNQTLAVVEEIIHKGVKITELPDELILN